MTKLKVKLLSPHAQMPSYAKPGDSGMDVRACFAGPHMYTRVDRDRTITIPTGCAFDIPEGYELHVRPRSGLSKQGLLVHFGTVDSGYRGEVSVCATNLRGLTHQINHGDRIAQLVLVPVERAELEQTEELSETERGVAGFGSTGRA